MSLFRVSLVAATIFSLAAPAMAQTAQTVGQASGLRQEAPVRIQTNFNFFVRGAAGDSEEARKARDNARRSIYEVAARECEILREVLAKECRLESVTSNIGQQYGAQQPEGFSVNGAMSFQVILR
jgi:hypothetical protein